MKKTTTWWVSRSDLLCAAQTITGGLLYINLSVFPTKEKVALYVRKNYHLGRSEKLDDYIERKYVQITIESDEN